LHFHVHAGPHAHIDHVGPARARFDRVDIVDPVDDAFTVQQAHRQVLIVARCSHRRAE
jgi:hypothetical protein